MNVVFDTNILISSTLWDNSEAQKLLFKLLENNVQIYCSVKILEEYKTVLKRDFKYENDEISELLDQVLYFVKLIATKDKLNVVKQDPNDNHVIECAIESESKFIITYDKDLLNLKEFEDIKIIKPGEFKFL
jgi:putative PIN family toxin of toxin-antitoxin system